MSEEIILNDSLLIGKGGGRACYIDPRDETKIIKVSYTKEGDSNSQNQIDYIYINYLKKQKRDLSYISSCYEYVKTNLGKGLVFDRVLNYDKTSSKSFRYLIANKMINLEEQKILLSELKNYLEKNEILFADNSLTNILCKEVREKQYKLIIIDGLGAKRIGLKFWLYLRSRIYKKYKIKKQWTKFMLMYQKDLKRIALNKNPITRF
ncbi:YrbL family protein [Aliarcobacter butzleri]|uniref:YrbL family protein n=1 Tax=Aliarcobacter butzleri TaxID=28197 RepID=UPI000F4A5383|nr:YrbL family protein [Aliarcobacter butzleri]MCG3711428.1 PhoP regulatory network YrbL family protein [Aliarcobacter butzleri]MCG3714880.1 PhoP regulatory network YrbL family protein [Aliarcobacter butzleri]MCT7582262.1 PhoP regulatory network YrbL family protein [Aliarcobacter butzleri]MCT7621490.1 PhoP regulatory network YrbL family protein [Aliarcobacter butzleri]